jgi:hypothetical protein
MNSQIPLKDKIAAVAPAPAPAPKTTLSPEAIAKFKEIAAKTKANPNYGIVKTKVGGSYR